MASSNDPAFGIPAPGDGMLLQAKPLAGPRRGRGFTRELATKGAGEAMGGKAQLK